MSDLPEHIPAGAPIRTLDPSILAALSRRRGVVIPCHREIPGVIWQATVFALARRGRRVPPLARLELAQLRSFLRGDALIRAWLPAYAALREEALAIAAELEREKIAKAMPQAPAEPPQRHRSGRL
ncbi:hypothetical protein C3Z06_25335 [Cupriavidus metallidurans]|nr:hypothetical protein C3Z06_23535 [Cupriavidus metallidurans]AVA36610.1 hypothetical protein C3Z06_25335 [Cupriavidus metallidurans]